MSKAGFYDVYALAPARTADAIERLLARFTPAREPSAVDYPVPRFASRPVAVFESATELIAWCVSNLSEPYALYWRSLVADDPAHAMAFFTADGGLILGLSVLREPERWLSELLTATGGAAGWIGYEEPPPDTVAEFQAEASLRRAGIWK